MRNNFIKTIGTAALLLIISAALQFSTPNIADPDSFYHLAHAKIYAQRGLFYSDFPWAQFSVVKNLKADIWYGFHLLLIPFTYIKDGILGIKIAGAAITFLTLAGFYWALTRLKITWPLVWTLIFTAAAPDVMYRLTMTRPHNLSLVLILITLALVLTRSRKITFALLGFLSAWLHIALSWLPLFIALVSNLILQARREPTQWKNIIYLTAGSALGLLARPNPLGAIKLAYIQVVQIIAIKLQDIPLTFGRELNPPTADMLLRNTAFVILILLAGLVLYRLVSRKINDPESNAQKNIFFSALAISVVFFFITAFVARRSYDIFTGFGLIAAASASTLYLKNSALHKQRVWLSILIIILGLAGLNSIPLFKKYNDGAWTPHHLKESALWLKENTQPGEIVFHTNWDQFGPLLFWNQNNYYINGMDPVFQYAYDPALYWKNHFMFTTDAAYNQTCGRIRCTAEEVEDTAQVLANDFKASYVVLRKAQNPKTFFYWVQDSKFPLVFENKQEAVFKVTSPDE